MVCTRLPPMLYLRKGSRDISDIPPRYLHRHQPNVPTAGAQAFLMDETKTERAITHHAQCGLVGASDCKCSRYKRLNVPSKFLITHMKNDQRCLTSVILRRAHCLRDHRALPTSTFYQNYLAMRNTVDVTDHHHRLIACFKLRFMSK
jgi:hypothetical protein